MNKHSFNITALVNCEDGLNSLVALIRAVVDNHRVELTELQIFLAFDDGEIRLQIPDLSVDIVLERERVRIWNKAIAKLAARTNVDEQLLNCLTFATMI